MYGPSACLPPAYAASDPKGYLGLPMPMRRLFYWDAPICLDFISCFVRTGQTSCMLYTANCLQCTVRLHSPLVLTICAHLCFCLVVRQGTCR